MAIVILVLSIIQAIVVIFGFYHGFISLFGIFPYKSFTLTEPAKKFAVLIAAHNEENVIENAIDSVKKQDYPCELYDILVICDNCSDGTAEVVRKNGAMAFERFNETERGKGFALEWMLKQLFEAEKQYDAVIVLDADNVISRDFLLHMNDQLCKGNKIIQGYLDTKNPDDSWVSLSYAISYWYMGRMWQLARFRLGLPNALGGTGMCFEINTLKELGWGATSLTEDLEFTMKAVLKGIKPVWAHYAKVYDEKPIEFQASWTQRLRWMRGHWDVAFRYIGPLFKRFLLKADVSALDCIVYLLQPSRILMSYFTLGVNIVLALSPYVYVFKWLHSGVNFPSSIWCILFVMQWILPPSVVFIMILERVRFRRLWGLIWYQFYGLSWLPLTLLGLVTRKNKTWIHTIHSKKIDIDEIEECTRNIPSKDFQLESSQKVKATS